MYYMTILLVVKSFMKYTGQYLQYHHLHASKCSQFYDNVIT